MNMMTIQEFIKFHDITMDVKPLCERTDRVEPRSEEDRDWDRRASHWSVTIWCRGKKLTTNYSMGAAHKGEPDLASVLDSLRSDSDADGQTFEDWASNLGWDTDSRKAEACFKACKKTAVGLRRVLGNPAFHTLLEGVEPL